MKKLVIVCGLPGVGKSTLAEAVASKLKLPVFSVDPIQSALLSVGMERNFTTGLAAYKVAEKLADEHLKLGQSVIIDAVSGVKEAKQMWRELAVQQRAKLIIIECLYTDEKLHKKRVEARQRNLPGFTELTWAEVKKYQKEYIEWNKPHLTLDSSNTIKSNTKAALDYIA